MNFKIRRADGRSNGQVIIDLVNGKEPGTNFNYDELSEALSAGTDHRYSRTEVQRIVVSACPRLLKEQARTLHNVPNVGYRIAPAAYHKIMADHRKSRADKQLLRGVQVLQNVRWEELDANQRMVHEGHLLITGALYQQMTSHERRLTAIERAIKKTRDMADKNPATSD